MSSAAASFRPWHLWLVGILSLLWNGSGTVTTLMAQHGMLPGISADEAAYYAAQPSWLVFVTDIALFGSLAGAIALLLRSRTAVPLFAISLAAIVITNSWDLVAGDSRALANAGAAFVTALIVILAVLQLLYARAMRTRKALQ